MYRLLKVTTFTLALGLTAAAGPLLTATLSGLQENPPNTSTATGSGSVLFNDALTEFEFTLTFSGLTDAPTLAHIHYGPVGTNGPVIFDFMGLFPSSPGGTFGATMTAADFIPRPAVGLLTFDDAVAAILAGNTYFNMHTPTYPGGEIRGQIGPVPEPSTLLLLSAGLAAVGILRRRRIC